MKVELCTKGEIWTDAHQMRIHLGRWVLALGFIAYHEPSHLESSGLIAVIRRRQSYVGELLHEAWQLRVDIFAIAIARRVVR